MLPKYLLARHLHQACHCVNVQRRVVRVQRQQRRVRQRQRAHPLRMAILRAEGAVAQRAAASLNGGTLLHQHAHAAIDLAGQAAAVAGIELVAPTVSLAEEFEGLAQDVRAGQRQIAGRRRSCGAR